MRAFGNIRTTRDHVLNKLTHKFVTVSRVSGVSPVVQLVVHTSELWDLALTGNSYVFSTKTQIPPHSADHAKWYAVGYSSATLPCVTLVIA